LILRLTSAADLAAQRRQVIINNGFSGVTFRDFPWLNPATWTTGEPKSEV
jgi:hypothetical protein